MSTAITSWIDRLSKAARDHISKHDIAALSDAVQEAVSEELDAVNHALDVAEGDAEDEYAPPDAPERVRLLAEQRDANAADAKLWRERTDAALEVLRLLTPTEPCVLRQNRCTAHGHDKPCPVRRAQALILTGEAIKNGSA